MHAVVVVEGWQQEREGLLLARMLREHGLAVELVVGLELAAARLEGALGVDAVVIDTKADGSGAGALLRALPQEPGPPAVIVVTDHAEALTDDVRPLHAVLQRPIDQALLLSALSGAELASAASATHVAT
jgi:AmiR/NasT family two-component response regulator